MSHHEHFADKHYDMIKRLRIGRESILSLRKKYGFKHEEGVAYGCIGLLDYIEHGDPDKIMHPNIRNEVLKTTHKEDES